MENRFFSSENLPNSSLFQSFPQSNRCYFSDHIIFRKKWAEISNKILALNYYHLFSALIKNWLTLKM